jgi:hypothetical protein
MLIHSIRRGFRRNRFKLPGLNLHCQRKMRCRLFAPLDIAAQTGALVRIRPLARDYGIHRRTQVLAGHLNVVTGVAASRAAIV